jgi:hypothetical protein
MGTLGHSPASRGDKDHDSVSELTTVTAEQAERIMHQMNEWSYKRLVDREVERISWQLQSNHQRAQGHTVSASDSTDKSDAEPLFLMPYMSSCIEYTYRWAVEGHQD